MSAAVCLAAAAIALAFRPGPLLAQTSISQGPSTLPATLPTSLTAPLNASSVDIPRVSRPHRAQVTFADGLLNVRADDSSLNQILHAISRLTGMTITGGVADQRVFGNYGPATPAAILATLLDGTGTNMLLREGDASTPVELVLTPRGGGPTPPNPNAAGFDDSGTDDRQQDDRQQDDHPRDRSDAPPPPIGFRGQAQAPLTPASTSPITPTQPQAPQQNTSAQQPSVPSPAPVAAPVVPDNNVLGNPVNTTPTASQIPTTNSVPIDTLSAPSTTVSKSQGIVDSANPPAPDSTTGVTPGGVPAGTPSGAATPQDIYQQLLKLQQQQQNKPATTTAPPQ